MFGLLVAVSPASHGFTFKELHPFSRPLQNIEISGVGADGTIYGQSSSGGPYNDGAIFQLTPSGSLTFAPVLTNGFSQGQQNWNVGPDNSLAKITEINDQWGYGQWVLRRVDVHGNLTSSILSDQSVTTLAFNQRGDLFGLSSGSCPVGDFPGQDAKIYSISADGQLQLLASWDNCPNWPPLPPRSFIAASDGNFYLLKENFGSSIDRTILKITPGGGASTPATFTRDRAFDLVE